MHNTRGRLEAVQLRQRWSLSLVTVALVLLTPAAARRVQPTERAALTVHGHHSYFVAPAGRADSEGTIGRPLDLATALSVGSPAQPGDTIWLRDGVYAGAFTSAISGAEDAPIVVRGYPGERPVIDSRSFRQDALYVAGDFVWFRDLEITNSDPIRHSQQSGSWPSDLGRGTGISSRASHVKFVDLIVHDLAGGFGIWAEAVDDEVYGNIVFNNGWEGPDRGHGHGIYTQNRTGPRRLRDNIVFNQYGHGIHAYGSSSAYLDHIELEGNVLFDNGALTSASEYDRNLLIGGLRLARRPVLRDNVTYYDDRKSGNENNIGYSAGCLSLIAERNYFVGGNPLNVVGCSDARIEGNEFYGHAAALMQATYPANRYGEQAPRRNTVRVRPNAFAKGRAHVVIFNWEQRPAVEVPLEAIGLEIGQAFEIRDVQDLFGEPLVRDVYSGRNVAVATVARTQTTVPIGAAAVGHTATAFLVLLVRPVESSRERPGVN